MSEDPVTDLAEASTREGHAWLEQVFRDHYAELCTFVCRYVRSDDVAEDILQDLFLSMWRGRERWVSAGDALRPLLYVAARNRALDHLKHRQVREHYAQSVLQEMPEQRVSATDEAVLVREVREEIDAAIQSLPERAREIFRLSREHGLTYREIAERLGLSIKTVENQMGRSLKKLRARLAAFV